MNPVGVTKEGLAFKQDLLKFKRYWMFYVYILKSLKDGRLYKGMTDNLDKRVKQHNNGENKSTKGFLPWVLVYHEKFATREEARKREKYFKSGVGIEFLKGLISSTIS